MSRPNQLQQQLTIPRPDGLEVAHDEAHHELIVTRRWGGDGNAVPEIIILFLLPLSSFFICIYLGRPGDLRLLVMMFLTLVISIWALPNLINSTTIRLNREMLTCLGPHRVKPGFLDELIYYGCRICGQSRRLIEISGQIEAVLDDQLAVEQRRERDVFQVNWLIRRELFDFDRIKIIDATDEAVERFAVQVGNDTDPLRRPRYHRMVCLVSPNCRLSENTRRILQRTFGQVI